MTESMMKLAVAGTEQASAALGRAAADAAAQFWPSGVPRSLPPWVYARLHWAPEGTERKGKREKRRFGKEKNIFINSSIFPFLSSSTHTLFQKNPRPPYQKKQ